MRLGGPNRTEHGFTDGGREHVLRTDLNYTWSVGLESRQKHPEIQVMRENDVALVSGKRHDQ